MASPATRRRASEIGLDLARVQGTGPGGRIVEADLERAQRGTPGITEIPVIGVRRVIAQRMAEAKRNAPHFAYVEEVDVTDLEALRGVVKFPVRIKCATLSWNTLAQNLDETLAG